MEQTYEQRSLATCGAGRQSNAEGETTSRDGGRLKKGEQTSSEVAEGQFPSRDCKRRRAETMATDSGGKGGSQQEQ